MGEDRCVSIRVTGEVQGVFFRQGAKEQADALGLTGFARNDPDGSVYIEVQGEKGNVEGFLAWCRRGPESARVSSVHVAECRQSSREGFSVRWR
jgi:acylphosphatase